MMEILSSSQDGPWEPPKRSLWPTFPVFADVPLFARESVTEAGGALFSRKRAVMVRFDRAHVCFDLGARGGWIEHVLFTHVVFVVSKVVTQISHRLSVYHFTLSV